MLSTLFLVISQALGYINLDATGGVNIFSNSIEFYVKVSSPSTGYVWYLLSEQEEKLVVQDTDGTYISGSPGYQNFTVFCNQFCEVGDELQLTLILKRPWEETLSVINTIHLSVIEK